MLIILKTSLVVAREEVIETYVLTEAQLIICYFVSALCVCC